jgi:pSer/pThr/pTyr-binding forkhead associated (FHA) protein
MPRLVIRQGEGTGRDHALGAGECVVGREPGVHFLLDDTLCSRRHFRVVQEGGLYFVEDLGSTNGTLLNGRKAKRERLSDGDRIRAGGTEMEFVQKDLFGGVAPARPPAQGASPSLSRRRRHLR